MINSACAVYHLDGICPGPYGKCTCDGSESNVIVPFQNIVKDKEHCEKCLKCPDYSKHDYCHDKDCSCHQTQQKCKIFSKECYEHKECLKSLEDKKTKK